MKVEMLELKKLRPYDKNPRINDKAVESVSKSIEKFGFNQPIVCNQDNIICVGHTRWKAASGLGLEKVPVYKIPMSEEEFIAYNIADNRTSENAEWDEKLLSRLLKDLEDTDMSMLGYTGFSLDELEDLMGDFGAGFNAWESDGSADKKGKHLEGIKGCIKIFCEREKVGRLKDFIQTQILKEGLEGVSVE